jgi:two-component system nitrogen regulation response regulator GlnG
LTPGDLTRFIAQRLAAGSENLYEEYAALTEGHLFRQVLAHTGGNLTQAARVLGINRGTLRTKVAALGIKHDG